MTDDVSTGEDGFKNTPLGLVTIRLFQTPGSFSHLKLDPGIGNFAHFSSIIQKFDGFEQVVREENGRVVLALVDEDVVIGYLTCRSPDPNDRWHKLADLMYELSAIEISRPYRKWGIAHDLIDFVINGDDFLNGRIAYMSGFSWHWDLDGCGLTMSEYRSLIVNLLKDFGFQEYYTNEPNIILRPENIFMARVGPKVSKEDEKKFRDLRFGIRLGTYR